MNLDIPAEALSRLGFLYNSDLSLFGSMAVWLRKFFVLPIPRGWVDLKASLPISWETSWVNWFISSTKLLGFVPFSA